MKILFKKICNSSLESIWSTADYAQFSFFLFSWSIWFRYVMMDVIIVFAAEQIFGIDTNSKAYLNMLKQDRSTSRTGGLSVRLAIAHYNCAEIHNLNSLTIQFINKFIETWRFLILSNALNPSGVLGNRNTFQTDACWCLNNKWSAFNISVLNRLFPLVHLTIITRR